MIGIISAICIRFQNFVLLYYYKRKWRKLNQHNDTHMINQFDFSKVTVGKRSYGPLMIYAWKSTNEKLRIGNYVSIAEGVKFILGGNHPIETLLSFPLKTQLLGQNDEACSKGEIVIEDDVWIGMGATVMSGVKIGQGSIIGACSVVARDVPPYAIVVGNPSKVIRYRFSTELIKELKSINLSAIDDKFVKENIDLLYKKITIESLNILKKQLEL